MNWLIEVKGKDLSGTDEEGQEKDFSQMLWIGQVGSIDCKTFMAGGRLAGWNRLVKK